MKFRLVDLNAVSANSSPLDFEGLDTMADLILESGGVVQPLLLKVSGVDPTTAEELYEVVYGDFVYHAAAEARKRDQRRGEVVNAFVLDKRSLEAAQQQAEQLSGAQSATSDEVPTTGSEPKSGLEQELRRVLKELQDVASANVRIGHLERDVETSKTQAQLAQISLLDAINGHYDAALEKTIGRQLEQTFIGSRGDLRTKIFDEKQQQNEERFQSYAALRSAVTGLGEKTLFSFIERWEELRKS